METKKIKRCCFAGHKDICDREAFDKAKSIANYLITHKGVTEFWVGDYGAFDRGSSMIINEIKEIHPHIELDLVIPYITNKIQEYRYSYYGRFDNIIIAEIPQNTPKQLHIIKSNEYMVNNSDFLICYIERSWGGAAKTYDYARKKDLHIFNVQKLV